MNYREAISAISELLTDQPVICANGLISREAFTIRDRPENFYMLGSMGLASSIALGVALSKPSIKVIVLDGDGNLLMNLGSLAMTGYHQPGNFLHIVLDNEVYASTGNQPTVSEVIRLEDIARAAGYVYVRNVTEAEALRSEVSKALGSESPSFILVKVSDKEEQREIGRVTHSPEEIKERFMSSISK